MSWKEVFKDISDMEGIVQEMEENEDLEEKSNVDGKKEDDKSKNTQNIGNENELKSKLLNEILHFNQKAQLRNVGHELNEVKSPKEIDEDTTPSDITLLTSDESKTNSSFKTGRKNPGLVLTSNSSPLNLAEEDKRRGSGILRRPSLGVEPTSPAPSADRLSVTFAMENVVVENEDDDNEIDKGPIAAILGLQ